MPIDLLPARGRSSVPSLKERAAKGALWISVEMIGVQLTSFAIFVLIARLVEPRDFGLISICFLAIQSIQMLLLYNVAAVAVRKQQASDLDYTTTFWVTIILASLGFLALMISAPWIEQLLKTPGLSPVLRAMSFIILFMGLARTHETWLMRHFHFQSLAIRSLVGTLIGGLCGLLLAWKGYGVTALVIQQVITSLISLLLLWVICPWRPNFNFSLSTSLEILSFLRQITPNSFMYAINQNCDTFLIAYFFGPVNVGIFNIGKRIRLTLQLITGDPIRGVAIPTLAEIQNDPIRLRRGVLHSLTLICAVCAPFFIGASAVSREAITVLFGQKWIAAAPVLQLLAPGGLAIILLGYNDNIFVLKNKQIWSLYISVIYTILATLSIIICTKLNITALALPFVLPYIIVFPLSAVLVSKLLSLSLQEWIAAMFPGIFAAMGMFVVVQTLSYYLIVGNDIIRLLILSIVGALCYFILIWSIWRQVYNMMIETFLHIIRKKSS